MKSYFISWSEQYHTSVVAKSKEEAENIIKSRKFLKPQIEITHKTYGRPNKFELAPPIYKGHIDILESPTN